MSRTLVVTGSSNGLGSHIASLFAHNGWHVIGIDKDVSDSKQIESWQYDLSDLTDVEQLCHRLIAMDKIDAFIANAADYHFSLFENTSVNRLKEIMQINTFSHFQILQTLLTSHHKKNLKKMICIGSDQIIEAKDYNIAYAMSKAALAQMTKSIATEQSSCDIITLCPTTIADTNITKMAAKNLAAIQHADLQTILDSFDQESPTGKCIQSSELADYIYQIMLDNISYISGDVIEVTPLLFESITN